MVWVPVWVLMRAPYAAPAAAVLDECDLAAAGFGRGGGSGVRRRGREPLRAPVWRGAGRHGTRSGGLEMKVGLAAGAVVAVGLAVPVAAEAAVIATQGACFFTGRPVPLNGGAFTPGAIVTIGGGVTGTAQADPAGSFTTPLQAPPVST